MVFLLFYEETSVAQSGAARTGAVEIVLEELVAPGASYQYMIRTTTECVVYVKHAKHTMLLHALH